MQVVQRGAGANMSVDVSVGDVHLELPSTTYSYWGWQDAVTNVVVTTAPATNSRIDAIVAWLDPSVVTTASNNSPGSLKFAVIVGTVAGSPIAPLDSAIQTALGASIAWTRLANVTVGTSVTSIVSGNVTDTRTPITSRFPVGSNAVSTTSLQALSVTNAKINDVSAVKFTNPYKFSAYRNAAWTTNGSASTYGLVTFDATSFDTGSNYSTSTGRFTTTVAGFYFFDSSVSVAQNNNNVTVALYKNGSVVKYGTANVNAGGTFNAASAVSGLLQLAASDYIQVFFAVSQANATGITGPASTFFDGFLVSQT